VRPVIVLLIGLPGSGKSTWAARQNYATLSSDAIRGWLADDPADQTIHRRVFGTLRYLLRQRLELRRPVTFIDSTSLTRRERRPYIKLADLYDCDIEAVFFDTPVEVCLERNRARSRVVPVEAILDMAGRLTPPSVEEGFARITVVRAE
jgi:predicted kinase